MDLVCRLSLEFAAGSVPGTLTLRVYVDSVDGRRMGDVLEEPVKVGSVVPIGPMAITAEIGRVQLQHPREPTGLTAHQAAAQLGGSKAAGS